ncbi:MAG: hypothetical protein K6E60_01375, partial [Saccharofermentans sp.]|nr:hypothetical protein [Saccharofermentans sp.]
MIDFSSIDNNMLYEKVLWIIVPAALLALIIAFSVWRAIEDRKRKREQAWAAERRKLEIVDGVAERTDEDGSKMRELERARREAEEFAEKAAETTNTLIGGKSEAEREEKEAIEVFGSLGISSKKAEAIDRQRDQLVINGYLQKSNTAPIRPVYSNTLEARRQQKEELNSDTVGDEANTPALVTDSAAPAKIKPTALKRPTAARVGKGSSADNSQKKEEGGEDENPMLQDVMRPEIGTEVENAVVERPAEVQEEKPDIMKVGEEAIPPAATEPVEGFKGSEETVKKAVRHKRPSSAAKQKNTETKKRSGSG